MDPAVPCLPQGRRARAWQAALCGTRARLHSDDVSAQFLRFVSVGALSSLIYFALFLALRGLGPQAANLIGAVLSSMLANELHRRLTFHAGDRVGWLTAQLEGGALAVAGLLATSTSLTVFGRVVGDRWWAQLLLIAGVTAAVGLIRFVALRLWVFSGHAHGPVARPA
jgi:putative flippase GtrA